MLNEGGLPVADKLTAEKLTNRILRILGTGAQSPQWRKMQRAMMMKAIRAFEEAAWQRGREES